MIWENHVMGMAQRLLLIAAVAMLPAGHAAAQTLPWPGDPQPQGGGPTWPGERAGPAAMPPMGPSPMGATPPRPMGGGVGGAVPPCMAEFTKLREDVEKKGMAAKVASQKKPAREEMCKYVTAYADAEAKWVKFTVSNVQSCGIPPQIADQLKQVHANTEQTKQKVCAAGGPSTAAPTLSDTLTAPRTTAADVTKSRSGTLDTLTGPVVGK
jgi:hypothetical protein